MIRFSMMPIAVGITTSLLTHNASMYEPPRIYTLKVNKKIPRFPYSRFSWESTPERWLHTSCYGSARREDRIFALTKSQASAFRLFQGGFVFCPSLQPGIGRHSVYQPVGGNHPFFNRSRQQLTVVSIVFLV